MLRYQIDSSRVEKMLDKMKKEIPDEIVGAVDDAIKAGVNSAKYLVPIKTGKLKRGIYKDEPTKKEGDLITGSYCAEAYRKEHNYGFYQEAGWTDRAGNYHEGKYYMKRSKVKAEKVFIKKCNQLLGRYAR